MVVADWLPYMAALVGFELAGDTVAKEFALHGSAWRMALAVALIACGNITWQLMLRAGMDLSRGGIIFAVSVAIGLVLIGVLGHGEAVGSRQLSGIGFGIACIWLLAA